MIIVYMMNGWNGQEIYMRYDEWMEWAVNREEHAFFQG
jgi:hypothetical protein